MGLPNVLRQSKTAYFSIQVSKLYYLTNPG